MMIDLFHLSSVEHHSVCAVICKGSEAQVQLWFHTACPLLLRIASYHEMLSLPCALSSHQLDCVHWGENKQNKKTSTYNSQSVFNCTSVMPICQCQEYSYSIALYRRKTEMTVHSNPQIHGLYTYVKLSSDHLKTSLCCWVLNIHILIYKRGKFCQQFVNEKRNKKKEMHWIFRIRYQHLTFGFVSIDRIECSQFYNKIHKVHKNVLNGLIEMLRCVLDEW